MIISIKDCSFKIILFILASLSCQLTFAVSQQDSLFAKLNPQRATMLLQIGGFNASQGAAQNINIDSLIGDYFTVNQSHANNALIGLGYYVDGLTQERYSVLYGINAFYLAHTSVEGTVIQEQMFSNLSYRYAITNYPIYAAAKLFIKNPNGNNDLTVDIGVGPNFINASNFSERSLDGGITVPDTLFSSQVRTVASVTAGIGIKLNKWLGVPCELGYRFFYLGEGSLKKNNDQVLNTLKTGDNYANALLFSIYF